MQGWLKSEQNFHFSIPAEVQNELFGDRLRDLIGHTGKNAMEHEWYTGPVYTQPCESAALSEVAYTCVSGDSVWLSRRLPPCRPRRAGKVTARPAGGAL